MKLDQLQVRQRQRDADDRQGERDGRDETGEREPPAAEQRPDDVADRDADGAVVERVAAKAQIVKFAIGNEARPNGIGTRKDGETNTATGTRSPARRRRATAGLRRAGRACVVRRSRASMQPGREQNVTRGRRHSRRGPRPRPGLRAGGGQGQRGWQAPEVGEHPATSGHPAGRTGVLHDEHRDMHPRPADRGWTPAFMMGRHWPDVAATVYRLALDEHERRGWASTARC